MRQIKLISSKGGYETNVAKEVFTNVLGSDGRIEKIPNILFDRDPRGNWVFTSTGKGYSEFILKETEDWANTTPTVVDKEIARRSPGIDVFYGEPKPYVTLEEALVAFFKAHKDLVIGREFAVVCDASVIDVIKVLIKAGWPTNRIEGYKEFEHVLDSNIQEKLEKEIEETKAKLAAAKKEAGAVESEGEAEVQKPKTARQKATAAKKEKEVKEEVAEVK